MEEHVSRDDAARLLEQTLARPQQRKVVRHLISGCLECAGVLREVLESKGSEAPDYTAMLRRCGLSYVVASGQVQAERKHADIHWPNLKRQPPELRLMMVRDMPVYQMWGIYERIMGEITRVSGNDPLEGVDLAHLALAVIDLLPTEWYGQARISDYRAGAFTALGNSKRLASDFEGAKSALGEAKEWLRNGTGDPYESINYLSIRASLTSDLGYLEDSTQMLFPAIRLARRVGDEQLEGKLFLQQSGTIGFVDPILALELAKKGAVLVGATNTHLELIGHYLVAYWSNDLGLPREAKRVIEEYRFLFASEDNNFWKGRLLNIFARIAREEGDLRHAEDYYRRLVTLFESVCFEFDLVLANLDLSSVLVEQGKLDEAAEILTTLYPVLRTWDLHSDILRSWLILVEGVRQAEVESHTFNELAMTLRRKWYRKA